MLDLRDGQDVERDLVLNTGVLVTLDLNGFDPRAQILPLDRGSWRALVHPGRAEDPDPLRRTVDLNAIGECLQPTDDRPQGCRIRQIISGASLSASQEGEGPTRTSNTCAQYLGQSAGSSIVTSTESDGRTSDTSGPAAGVASGIRSGWPQIAAASRASPMWFRQSGRFAVISRSMTGWAPVSTDATSNPRSPSSVATMSGSSGTSASSRSQ